jgi:hypothetical protein
MTKKTDLKGKSDREGCSERNTSLSLCAKFPELEAK